MEAELKEEPKFLTFSGFSGKKEDFDWLESETSVYSSQIRQFVGLVKVNWAFLFEFDKDKCCFQTCDKFV